MFLIRIENFFKLPCTQYLNLMTCIRNQYEMVKSSRLVLFDFCRSLSRTHFLFEHPDFGRGSIRNLLVHVANVYQFWIGEKALNHKDPFTSFDAVADIEQADSLYREIDQLMNSFILLVEHTPMKQLTFERNGVQTSEDALTLFTHAITHEFHHKGQILSMSRHMGYLPVDTDMIR